MFKGGARPPGAIHSERDFRYYTITFLYILTLINSIFLTPSILDVGLECRIDRSIGLGEIVIGHFRSKILTLCFKTHYRSVSQLVESD